MVALTLIVLFLVAVLATGYQVGRPFVGRQRQFKARSSSSLYAAERTPPLLNGNTVWRLRLNLVGQDGKPALKATARIRFVEEKGYEPPSGKVFIENDFSGIIRTNEKGYASTWTLSEDRNDRKDGLWIMGLFKEPKYPYLYFSLTVFETFLLPNGEEQPFSLMEGSSGVPGDKLNFVFNHLNKGPEDGRVLSGGVITFKNSEILNLPLTKVDIGEEVSAGTVELSPVYDNDESREKGEEVVSTGLSAQEAAQSE
jgi:hypothetical protein